MATRKSADKKVGSLHGSTDFQNLKQKRAEASADFDKNRKPHSIHRKNISK